MNSAFSRDMPTHFVNLSWQWYATLRGSSCLRFDNMDVSSRLQKMIYWSQKFVINSGEYPLVINPSYSITWWQCKINFFSGFASEVPVVLLKLKWQIMFSLGQFKESTGRLSIGSSSNRPHFIVSWRPLNIIALLKTGSTILVMKYSLMLVCWISRNALTPNSASFKMSFYSRKGRKRQVSKSHLFHYKQIDAKQYTLFSQRGILLVLLLLL